MASFVPSKLLLNKQLKQKWELIKKILGTEAEKYTDQKPSASAQLISQKYLSCYISLYVNETFFSTNKLK